MTANRWRIVPIVVLLSGAGVANAAAGSGTVDRLYVLSCGEGLAGDISRWSPGVDVGKSMPMSENCYLIRHAGDWMLWDTGIPDAVAAMPGGQKPADPRAIHWYRPKTLASQLAQLGVKPGDVRYIGISHTHPDHVGNVDLFPTATVLMQRAEYDWAFGQDEKPFTTDHPVTKLEGDRDVFGDGSATILSTPGHTPGHQSLVVHLAKTGWVVLTGDAAHFKANWDARRVPSMNVDADKTRTSMERLADVVRDRHAQLWINHDKAQTDGLRHAPDAYE